MARAAARPADGRMPLVEHLRELRRRLTWSALAYAAAVAVTYAFWSPVFDVLRQPYCGVVGPGHCNLVSFGIFDQFQVRMRVGFIGGAVLSSPVWLYQLGAFITPALHRKERRYAAGFLLAALVFFTIGAGFAYLTLSHGLRLLLHVAGNHITILTSLKEYLSFVSLILLLFGLAFEFPVVIVFLNVVGVLSAARMRAWRRGMIVGLFFAAAVLTPSTDPFTFLALGVPLVVLYEACILIARLRERGVRGRAALDPLHTLDDDLPSPIANTPSQL